jgi:hypothetical protein
MITYKNKTLTESIRNNGWPDVSHLKGKIIISTMSLIDEYNNIPGDNMMFNLRTIKTSNDLSKYNDLAIVKIDNAISDNNYNVIKRTISEYNLIVRTRANTQDGRDLNRELRALYSGTQLISFDTDPELVWNSIYNLTNKVYTTNFLNRCNIHNILLNIT